jgi:RNA polymerase sigma-70 factor (ECF subfamily)
MAAVTVDSSGLMSRDDVLAFVRERIVRFAASRIGPDKAEDLAQEALIVLNEKYATLDSLDDLVPVAIQIVRFKMYSKRRKDIRHGEQQIDEEGGRDPRDERPDPEQLATRREREDRLRGAVRMLKGRCREIFRLKLDGKPFAKIQQSLGASSINTVYTWDRRCRQELIRLMGGSFDG